MDEVLFQLTQTEMPEKVRCGVCLSTQGPLQEQQALKGGEEGGREQQGRERRNSGGGEWSQAQRFASAVVINPEIQAS